MSVISHTSGLPLYFTSIIFVNLPEIVPVVLVGGYYTPHTLVATSLTAFSALNLLARSNHPKHVHVTMKINFIKKLGI